MTSGIEKCCFPARRTTTLSGGLVEVERVSGCSVVSGPRLGDFCQEPEFVCVYGQMHVWWARCFDEFSASAADFLANLVLVEGTVVLARLGIPIEGFMLGKLTLAGCCRALLC